MHSKERVAHYACLIVNDVMYVLARIFHETLTRILFSAPPGKALINLNVSVAILN